MTSALRRAKHFSRSQLVAAIISFIAAFLASGLIEDATNSLIWGFTSFVAIFLVVDLVIQFLWASRIGASTEMRK